MLHNTRSEFLELHCVVQLGHYVFAYVFGCLQASSPTDTAAIKVHHVQFVNCEDRLLSIIARGKVAACLHLNRLDALFNRSEYFNALNMIGAQDKPHSAPQPLEDTMTKSMQIKDTTGVAFTMVLAEDETGVFPKHLGATSEDRLFATFSEFDTVNDWEVLATGSGMTIGAVAGGGVAGASPYLPISSGVTANAQTVIASRGLYRAPIEARVGLSASQRIANNTLRFGFLECDENGGIVVSTDFNTAPELLNAKNGCMLDFASTTATQAAVLSRQGGGGIDTLTQTFTGFTSAATGTSPNFLISDYIGISLERDRVAARNYEANITTNTGVQVSRDMNVPNPTKFYRFVIIVENGSTAPASSTDWRLHFVNLLDATRFDVSPRHAGVTDAQRGFPVNVLNQLATVGTTLQVATEYVLAASLATTNAVSIKNAVGNIQSIAASNLSGSTRYLKLYRKATAPTVGTDVPVIVIP